MTGTIRRRWKYFIAIFLLVAGSVVGTADAWSQANMATGTAKKSKADISFRISTALSLSQSRFSELLDFFDKHRGVTDEITFFTSITHPPPKLEDLKQRVGIFRSRMEQARKRGYKPGINVLNTVGHHDENMENALDGSYTRMTDINGQVCKGAFCPNDENFREQYVAEVYKATALANPDYIWIDDDVRMQGHGPVRHACFCDICIKKFNNETGSAYTRESLK